MNLNDAQSVPFPRKRSFRVGRGRGSGWGGGIMREGGQMPLVRRVPKKGFGNSAFRIAYEVVNVERLKDIAVSGAVTPEILKEAGLIKKSARWVKVLGDGDAGAALKVSAHHFSKGAREKIEKAGGTALVLPGRHGKAAPASTGERHAFVAAARIAEAAKRAAMAPKKKGREEAPEEGADEAKAAKRAQKAEKAEKAEKAHKAEKAPGGDGGEHAGPKHHSKPGKQVEPRGEAKPGKPGEKKPGKKKE